MRVMFPSLSPRQRISLSQSVFYVRNLGAQLWIQSSPPFLSLFLAPRRAGSRTIFGSTGMFLYRLLEIWFARLMCLPKFSGTKSVTNCDALYGETDETGYDARSFEREIEEVSVKFHQIARGLRRKDTITNLCALVFRAHLALILAFSLNWESQPI